MIRMVVISTLGLSLAACAPNFEAEPTSVYQWERRQQEIQRREAERVRLCGMMNKDGDRYKRDCRRPGDPN